MTPPGLRLLCPLALLCLAGCHSTNHAFRDGAPPHTVSVLSLAPPTPPIAGPTEPPPPRVPCDANQHPVRVYDKVYQDAVATVGAPCIAFLEFDDMGENLDRKANHQPGVRDQWGAAHQLDAALYLIKDSTTYARNHGGPPPIVLVFVHGWKHNASEDDSNVKGFQQVIRYLSGQPVAAMGSLQCAVPKPPLACEYRNHPIIGVYIGWRGDLFNKHLPVLQDLSYFDREAAAERTGTDNLTHALMSISTAAGHGADASADTNPAAAAETDTKPPFLMFIGHSFGGLVLERAVSQALIREMDRQAFIGKGFLPLADLIVYVNTAAAATFSKPVVDILAQRSAFYEPHNSASSLQSRQNALNGEPQETHNYLDARPLIVSISTSADAATSIVLPIGQTIGSLPKHLTGTFQESDPLSCFDPYHDKSALPKSPAYNQSLFYTHSAPHLEQLYSHDVIELVDKDKQSLKHCPDDISGLGKDVVSTYGGIAGRCFAVVEHPGRCNGTPYWILSTDKAIIPDHGTIFTGRFISFLSNFLPEATPASTSTVSVHAPTSVRAVPGEPTPPPTLTQPAYGRTLLNVQPLGARPQDKATPPE